MFNNLTIKTTVNDLTTSALGALIKISHITCDTARKIHASLPDSLLSISGEITRTLTNSPTSIVTTDNDGILTTDNGWELIDDFKPVIDTLDDNRSENIELMKIARDLEMGLPETTAEEKDLPNINDVTMIWDLESGRLFDKYYNELDRKE